MMSSFSPICSNIEELTEEMEAMDKRIANLKKENADTQKLVHESSREVEMLKDKIIRLNDEITEAKQREDEVNNDMENSSKKIKASNNEVEEIHSKIISEGAEMDSLVNNFELLCHDFVDQMIHLDPEDNSYKEFDEEMKKRFEMELSALHEKKRSLENQMTSLPFEEMKTLIKTLDVGN